MADRDAPASLDVRFEDDVLLVVAKPAGVAAHPSPRRRGGTLLDALRAHAEHRGGDWEPRLVQRLDRGTSGLLVVAKSAAVHRALQSPSAAFSKTYLALVWGRPSPRAGVIDAPIGHDPLHRRHVMIRASGSPATTRYTVVAHGRGGARGLSLLECELVTGRMHQLRVHLASAGWPLVGDAAYTHAPAPRLGDPILERAVRAFGRQALHAWRLGFRHPRTGEALTFVEPPPADVLALLALANLRAIAATRGR